MGSYVENVAVVYGGRSVTIEIELDEHFGRLGAGHYRLLIEVAKYGTPDISYAIAEFDIQ